jgi:predicted Zn-ribbon and HTH transcriptional regulator
MAAPPREPVARAKTIRHRLAEVLSEGDHDAHELSVRTGISEKDVTHHLEHLERSLRARGQKLRLSPARCAGCGFVFRERRRLGKPSACPRCRSTHIDPPRFGLEAGPSDD